MSTQKTLNYSGSLKIGDTVLLFYNADKDNEATTGSKSGYISADLSGYVHILFPALKTQYSIFCYRSKYLSEISILYLY